jgi:hypothetical protein
MHKYFLLLFLLLSLSSYCQFLEKGSYCIGAIGKDGIILAADSRGMLYYTNDPLKKPVCYYDSVQKVFLVNRFALAFVGNSTVNDYYLRIIVNQYKLNDFSKVKGDSVIYDFLKFCKKIFKNDSVYNSFILNTKIMSIGYEKNKPFVCYYDLLSPFLYVKNPKSSFISAPPDYFRPHYSDTLSCFQLAKIAEKSIYEYAEKQNFTDIIGGEIMVIQLNKDNSHKWLLHSPKYARKWSRTADFDKDYKAGKIKITPAKGKTEKDIYNLFHY